MLSWFEKSKVHKVRKVSKVRIVLKFGKFGSYKVRPSNFQLITFQPINPSARIYKILPRYSGFKLFQRHYQGTDYKGTSVYKQTFCLKKFFYCFLTVSPSILLKSSSSFPELFIVPIFFNGITGFPCRSNK